ncbi:MAG: N-acetyltransferase [Balneolaceae bacterium]|nr:N-acetyltransferase [Balneolaceae bacterium]
MNFKINIRPEKESDISQIRSVVKSAFENLSYSNQKEHLLVDALRKAGALDLSLLAEINGKIVGHIAFSEITINEENCSWFGLAPVSVHSGYQNKGIGSKLILEGLDKIKKSGAKGCVLLGEPEYYNRFGFQQNEQLMLQGVPPEYFLIKSFTDYIPEGLVEYHPLFKEFS